MISALKSLGAALLILLSACSWFEPISLPPLDDGAPDGRQDGVAFASPSGTGTACSSVKPCSLHEAQRWARARTASQSFDLVILLRGGRYDLAQAGPLVLDPKRDSGQHGYTVQYRAAPGEIPELSGAHILRDWTMSDPERPRYRTNGRSTHSRHLIVDGAFATRARGLEGLLGYSRTDRGYLLPNDQLARVRDPSTLELVSLVEWMSFRCPVQGVAGNEVIVGDLCWQNANWHKPFVIRTPNWFENAPEFLDEPGEFYRPSDGSYVDFIPYAGLSMAHADIREPVLTRLIEGRGAPDDPLHDIVFDGIRFRDTTWPLGAEGFAEFQAGIYVTEGRGPSGIMPAAVSLSTAANVRVSNSSFEVLGAAGISLAAGSCDNTIVNNTFRDLAGVAIQVGDVREPWHHHPAEPRQTTRGNTIQSNYITRIGREFPGSPGIWVGYAEATTIANNELFDLPYTAVSVGWGWGFVDVGGSDGYQFPAASSGNVVAENRIEYYLRRLRDGGGVYTLGSQQGSSIWGNYIANQGRLGAGIYLDMGTSFYEVRSNVLASLLDWYFLQDSSPPNARFSVLEDNFSQYDISRGAHASQRPDPSNRIANNTIFGETIPAEAVPLILSAGLPPDQRFKHPRSAIITGSATASTGNALAATDDDGATSWSSSGADRTPWWQVDLGRSRRIARIELVLPLDAESAPSRSDLRILGSNETSFEQPFAFSKQVGAPLEPGEIWSIDASQVAARWVRIERATLGPLSLAEVRILEL